MQLLNPFLIKKDIVNSTGSSGKIVIRRQDLSLRFLLARDLTHTYKVVYLITINSPQMALTPEKKLSPANIDMNSLKKSILDCIDVYDKKYMILHLFDDKKAEFYFETDKWLKDTLVGVKADNRIMEFSRIILFKKRPPNMIMFDPARQQFEKYVIRKFNEYMEKNHKEATWFSSLFPDTLRSKIRQKLRTMFDWQYDLTWNKLTATLKPMFIFAALYATKEIISKMKTADKNSKQEAFETRVKKNLPIFDTNELKKIILNKRGI